MTVQTYNQLFQPNSLDIDPTNCNQLSTEQYSLEIINLAVEKFGERLVMSTSFGIQSAVMLHLATQVYPNIPVIWTDTGYLPQETYHFAEQLTEKLNLNLKVYQSSISPARMEATYGKLWEREELAALNLYDRMRKVEPMQRALKELKATAWLAGLRKEQTQHRKTLSVVHQHHNYYKIHPILNWTTQDVWDYLKAHNLPHHPLFEQGYRTVGDAHSSRPMNAQDTDERATRFQGLKQECGLHLEPQPVPSNTY